MDIGARLQQLALQDQTAREEARAGVAEVMAAFELIEDQGGSIDVVTPSGTLRPMQELFYFNESLVEDLVMVRLERQEPHLRLVHLMPAGLSFDPPPRPPPCVGRWSCFLAWWACCSTWWRWRSCCAWTMRTGR